MKRLGWLLLASLALLPAAARAQTSKVLHSFADQSGGPSYSLVEASGGRLIGIAGGAAGRGEIYLLTPDGGGGFSYSTLYTFTADTEGQYPSGALVRGNDDLLYGTTWQGGTQDRGTVFRMDDNGAFENLASLGESCGALTLASDGFFYGSGSGGDGWGTVCRMDIAGNVTILKSFTAFEGRVADVLTQGGDGALYGSLRLGGIHSYPGAVFRLSLAGDYSVLHMFDGNDGEYPAGLVLADDGNLYGTTQGGGLGYGTIFRVDGAGVFSVAHEFADTEGTPLVPLTIGGDGKLYGTTYGGSSGFGFVFRFDPVGTLETLAPFSNVPPEGFGVSAAMMQASDTKFYGVTSGGGPALIGTVFRFDSASVSSIYGFHPTDGWSPQGSLAGGADGKLYGVTPNGGTSSAGTAFRLDFSGAFETFHSFSAGEGQYPVGGPLLSNGGFFGTTLYADTATDAGTFYRLDSAGALTVLHEFADDPMFPPAELILASDGNFYGVEANSIIRIGPLGAVTVLSSDLQWVAQRGLVQGADGALYGATASGGAYGNGTIFRVALDGTYSVLHEFSYTDGSGPNGGLLQASDGYLYGTTLYGGLGSSLGAASGTVFRVDLAGNFRTLYLFSGPDAGDAVFCNGHLTEASDGYIYGTAAGIVGGMVFRLDTAGNETIVHTFNTVAVDGSGPRHGLMEASDGLLYGTTERGGRDFAGTVYRIDPSTIFPVTAISPTSGPSSGGTAVTISGEGFQAGATVRIGGWTVPLVGSVTGDTEVATTTPQMAAGMLHHVFVMNPDGTEGSLGRAFLGDFEDVPQADIFHDYVEKLFRDGVTAGCYPGSYCRDSSTARAQMAVFLLKSLLGLFYAPPPATGLVFSDIPADYWAGAWIEDLAARGVTFGCGGGLYCPEAPVTRAQMAVFLLKTLLGPAYAPPAALGIFDDVPVGSFAADWIEDLAGRGITAGCWSTPPLYCPGSPNTRGQMAVFVVKTFGLP